MDDGKELTDLKAELEKLRKQIREFEQISNQNKKDIGTSARHPWRNDLILHNSPDGLALVGMDGKIIDANPALCRILGYPKDELIGIDIRILEAREVPEETTNHMNKIAKEGGDRFETRLRRLDGSIIDAEINTNLCDNGDERFFITFTQDITQRKEAEEALRESEEKYRTLVEMSPYAIAIFQDDKLVFANQTAERLIWGASGEKLIGRIGFEMVSEHDRDRLRDYAKKRYQGDSSAPNHYRVDLIRANGEIFPAEIFSNRIIYRGRPAIQLMATDITDRITAAKALQESETKFRTLVEQINAVTYEALPDENVSAIYVSPQIQKLIGFTADEIISNPFLWLGQIHPDDRQRVKDEIARTFPHGLPFSLEYRLLSKDGRIVWVHDEAIPKCDAQGRPIGFHGVILDITRLKETEATLAFSEKRFQQLFNSALEGISIHDPHYIIQFCNPSLAKIFEINDVSEIIGKSTLDYMPDDQKQIIIDQLELRKKGLATQYELNIVTVRNNRKTLLVSSSPIFDPDGKFQGSLSAVIDITERRELEKIQNTLMRISEATSLTESLEELLQTIRNAIGDLVDTSNFYIALWDDNTEVYSFPYRVDSISPAPGGPVKLVNTLTDFVRRTGQPLLATAEDREKLGLSVDFDNINKTPISWLGVPLKIFERVIGVVAVQAYSSEGFYTERDLKYLSMVAGHIGMAIERKRAEDDLRESERRFHDLFEHFASGYILCKVVTNDAGQPVDFIYLEVNKAFEIITGKSATEVINKSATEVFPIDYDIELIKLCGEVALTGTPVRTERFSLATGRYLEMMIYSTRYGEFASVFSDVSEKKIAEKALHDSEERYRAIWENSPVGICMTDPNGVYHYVNKTYCNIYGYSSEELIGRPFYDLIMPPERRASARVSFAKNFGKSKTGELSETEIFIRKNGEPVSIQFTSDYVMQDGQPKYEVAMNIDVTEKKRAVDALRESEERYRLLIENADDIIVNLDYSGKILLLNRAAARYFKKAPSELVGQTIWDLFPAETAQHYIASVRKTLDSNETLNIERMVVLQGEIKWFKANLQPIIGSGGQAASVLIITRDTTIQKQVEIRSQARLEFLQRLRQAKDVDECLSIGCRAIYKAQLFKRAVLTLHNENRAIINLGQVGLEEEVLTKARKGSAPDLGLAKKITQDQFRIGRSYFIPAESGIMTKSIERYVPQTESLAPGPGKWQFGDELFVPIVSNDNSYEGWLSVDTPIDGMRPTADIVSFLEEVVDITSKQVHELQSIGRLRMESKALEDTNVALREVLRHIDEDKMEIRQKIGNNVSQILIPAFLKLIRKDGTLNTTYYNILKDGLPELVTASGAAVLMYSKLSPREREICNMIKSGSTSKEIADTLNISPATVQKHRELIRRKLGIVNKGINLSIHLKGL